MKQFVAIGGGCGHLLAVWARYDTAPVLVLAEIGGVTGVSFCSAIPANPNNDILPVSGRDGGLVFPFAQSPSSSDAGAPVPGPDRLGLLCHEVMDANFLTSILYRIRPDLPVDVLYTREDLEAWTAQITPLSRLLAFCSGVVVPAEILGALGGPAYNVHPGSPDYPGRFPTAFACYDETPLFGATLHEMAVRVDSGPIVGVVRFEVPSGSPYQWLAGKAHQAAIHLFLEAARDLACSSAPLRRLPVAWGPRRCTQKLLEQACCLPVDITDQEMERRQASFGQVLGAKLYITICGRRFDLAA